MSGFATDFVTLQPGLDGLLQTIPEMQRLVFESLKDPQGRAIEFAQRILVDQGATPSDRLSEAKAFFDFVARNVTFTRDPEGQERLQHPLDLMEHLETFGWASGDCDDHAMLMATLCNAVRVDCPFVYVGDSPTSYAHVLAAFDDLETGQLVALDTGDPHPIFGALAPANVHWVIPSLPAGA